VILYANVWWFLTLSILNFLGSYIKTWNPAWWQRDQIAHSTTWVLSRELWLVKKLRSKGYVLSHLLSTYFQGHQQDGEQVSDCHGLVVEAGGGRWAWLWKHSGSCNIFAMKEGGTTNAGGWNWLKYTCTHTHTSTSRAGEIGIRWMSQPYPLPGCEIVP
jgi:hypothetical protein